MFGFGILSWVKILAVVAVVTVIGLGYAHYTSLVSERDQLKVTVALQEKSLAEWNSRWEEMRVGLETVDRIRREAEEYQNEIRELLAKHDLNRLTVEKPGLLGRRVNRATAERFRVLGCITDPKCASKADSAPSD